MSRIVGAQIWPFIANRRLCQTAIRQDAVVQDTVDSIRLEVAASRDHFALDGLRCVAGNLAQVGGLAGAEQCFCVLVEFAHQYIELKIAATRGSPLVVCRSARSIETGVVAVAKYRERLPCRALERQLQRALLSFEYYWVFAIPPME
jgi:hypothetical protein